MTWIKVCGITCLEDAVDATQSGANAIGFVFAESPRKVTIEETKTVISHLPESITKVGVFVNESAEIVKKVANDCNLNMLQFHGEESPEYCLQFRDCRYGVIKSFQIKNKNSIRSIKKWHRRSLATPGSPPVDFYLLDTFDKSIRGGTGKTFNWVLALLVKKQGVPIILSGGLNEHNVREAIRKVKPFGVDVSSGVESSPGKKDANKIQKFIEAVRSERCVT